MDSLGNCVPIDPANPPPSTESCQTGYETDGNGGCMLETVVSVCADGYARNSSGICFLPAAPCPDG